MARERSIPKYLEASILNRWVLGDSVQKIADWIEAGNRNRVKPVETSRSSVERVIARHGSNTAASATLATVHRLQRQAPEQLKLVERIEARYLELAKEAETLGADDTPLASVRLRCAERARYLGRTEMTAFRMLRLSGLGGAQTHKVLDRNADLTEAAATAVAQEQEQERRVEEAEEALAEQLGGRSEEAVIEEMIRQQGATAATTIEQPEVVIATRLDDENAAKARVIETGTPGIVAATAAAETGDDSAPVGAAESDRGPIPLPLVAALPIKSGWEGPELQPSQGPELRSDQGLPTSGPEYISTVHASVLGPSHPLLMGRATTNGSGMGLSPISHQRSAQLSTAVPTASPIAVPTASPIASPTASPIASPAATPREPPVPSASPAPTEVPARPVAPLPRQLRRRSPTPSGFLTVISV